jgi:TonB family protein
MIARKAFGSFICMVVFFSSTAKTTISQQTQPAPPQKSIAEQAIDVVLDRYRIDPESVVPKTGKPLPSDGSWATSKSIPDSCPKSTYPCVRLLYRIPDKGISCEWTVLLMGGLDEDVILDVNEDAAHYLTVKTRDGLPNSHAISQPSPIYPLNALQEHVQGTVKMMVHITATGQVDKVTVITGPEILRSAAVDAVKKWVYKPFIVDSVALPLQIVATVHFRMGRRD